MDDEREEVCGWTIYHRPSDSPPHWAVRMWWVYDAGVVMAHAIACLCESLDEARAQIPAGAICVPRDPEDDPVIAETWL